MGRFATGLFLFHRDLRLEDNTGLNAALAECDTVVPAFIFDPRQTDKHPYFSPRSFRFLLDSLAELSHEVGGQGGHLARFAGPPAETVARLARDGLIDAIYYNRDTTPFARRRDREIHDACVAVGIPAFDYGDTLLHDPDEVLKGDGTPYRVFTPYYRHALTKAIRVPEPMRAGCFSARPLPGEVVGPEAAVYPAGSERPGRKAGLARLEVAASSDYEMVRDALAVDGTTHLSAHHKFGTVSIRESWHRLVAGNGGESGLVRQLAWRDFFSHIGSHYPHVYGAPFHLRYRKVVWDAPGEKFGAWCQGRTGFPIVDAGMRELNTTGFMHNRARMIVASFLVKDLHVDWREGEQYFARQLVDYDPAVNNGGWQWAASTGCDAQPYFRIFSPWRQQLRFDPQAAYIKRWVLELTALSAGEIHRLAAGTGYGDYPPPMVDHGAEAREAKVRFGRIAK